jgi:membrane protease YdiL (CAAX protease family)
VQPSTDLQVPRRHRPPAGGKKLGIVFGILGIVYLAGFAFGGEAMAFMLAGLQAWPFMILALLAYLGISRLWAKIGTLIWLAIIVGVTSLFAWGMGFAVQLEDPTPQPGTVPTLVEGAGGTLAALAAGILIAITVGALGFVPDVRRGLSRVLPIDPNSFVHMVALVAVVALTLISFVPLLVLAAPPLLVLVAAATEQGQDLTRGRGETGMLLETVYGLVWMIPATIVAVGYGVRRNLREALVRLGLVRPTWWQVVVGLGLAVVLVIGVGLLSTVLDRLWEAMGWPTTDTETFGELLAFAMSPIGAVVIGVTAGLGEELAVRGVLQPRLGILLSNLFFTSLHAFQYNWDALLVVFLLGLTLGLVRKYTNTTTSAITHGVYDFLLIMATVLQVPWLGE